MFYRVKGSAYPEVTDSAECYARYSNALLNAAVALPEEISTRLRPVASNTPGTDWRTFTNWVDGTTNRWIRVATMKFTGSWAWNSLLTPGAHTMSNGWSAETWITLYPDVRQLWPATQEPTGPCAWKRPSACRLAREPTAWQSFMWIRNTSSARRPALTFIPRPADWLPKKPAPIWPPMPCKGFHRATPPGSRLPSTREATRPPTSITVGPGPGWDTPVTMRIPRTAPWGSANTWCPVAATPTTGDPVW